MIAEKYNLTRDDLDKISGQSHENAAEAIKKGIIPMFSWVVIKSLVGYFKKEIMPIKVKKADGTEVVVDKDEGVRVPVVCYFLILSWHGVD